MSNTVSMTRLLSSDTILTAGGSQMDSMVRIQHGTKRQLITKWFLFDGYLYDWMAAIVLCILAGTIPLVAVQPLDRFYVDTDATLMYPMESSTVPSSALYILTFVLPAFVVGGFALYTRSLTDFHHAALTWVESFGLTSFFKRFMNLVGVLRPHWLAAVASGEESDIDFGRTSYPSGHSAYIFFSMTALSLYLMGKLHLLTRPGKAHFLMALLCVTPMGLATFVALSRIADYKHAPADVNAGSFLGIMCGAFCYFLNYYSVFDKECDKPRLRSIASESDNMMKTDDGKASEQ